MKNKIISCLVFTLLITSITCSSDKNRDFNTSYSSPIDHQEPTQNQYQKSWEKIYFGEIIERIKGTDVKNLKDLVLPPNSKEIRIWAGFDTSPLRGIIIQQNNRVWSASYVPPLDSSNSSRNSQKLSLPKSGWEFLWKELQNLGIMTLPDPMDIAQIDERSVVIEVKTSDLYRTYKYSGVNNSKETNYKKVLEICNFLTNQFGVELCKYYKPQKTGI